jgi:hypothetical protein
VVFRYIGLSSEHHKPRTDTSRSLFSQSASPVWSQIPTKYGSIQERYNSDKAKGVEVPFVQYLYLTDMVNAIRKKKLFRSLGYQSAGKCGDALGSVVSLLRDAVAHPIRSLIVDPESCTKLWEQIDQIEGVLFHLR